MSEDYRSDKDSRCENGQRDGAEGVGMLEEKGVGQGWRGGGVEAMGGVRDGKGRGRGKRYVVGGGKMRERRMGNPGRERWGKA